MQKSKLQRIWRSNGAHGGTHYLTTPPLPRLCLLRGWGKRYGGGRGVGRSEGGKKTGWVRVGSGLLRGEKICLWMTETTSCSANRPKSQTDMPELVATCQEKKETGRGSKALGDCAESNQTTSLPLSLGSWLLWSPHRKPSKWTTNRRQSRAAAPLLGLISEPPAPRGPGGGRNGSKRIQNVAGIHQLSLANAEMKHFEHVCWLYFNEK